ncbi:DUF1254 domain-containing protein [Oerskovia sp. M15]
MEAGIGVLNFTDGFPSRDTAERLRDHLDYLHGVDAFMNTIQGVSSYAIRQGFLDAGINDGDFLICSELMDSRGLFLTPNADTVYFWGFLDLTDGPLVVETPENTLGAIDDLWFGWITDFGLPERTADRAAPTCWSDPPTTDLFPRAATTCATPAPITWISSAAPSSTRTKETSPAPRSPRSRRSSRSTRTPPAAWAAASAAT